jgi:erythromycin esterase-like protein
VIPRDDQPLVEAVARAALPLRGELDDFDHVLGRIGDAPLVLIGEASHGTHEFYHRRALLTRRLIREKGFTAVAAEADWPDAYRVNRFVKGRGSDPDAERALAGFERFPAWMWRNADVLDFVGWLRAHNDEQPDAQKTGFYGLDLYSLHASMNAVVAYLESVDPEAARRARYRYSCFEHFGEDLQRYGYATSSGMSPDCRREVVAQLVELRRRRDEILRSDGHLAEDEFFQAEQNARVVRDAEGYYRAMFAGETSTWNLRDVHMADTLDALLQHLRGQGRKAKIVVWAHNSHVGDARATVMGRQGEQNIGQLARERHPGETCLIGFSTHSGTVTAATDWGEPAERKRVRHGLEESWESVFHRTEMPGLLLDLRGQQVAAFGADRLQRAIGVIYRPETERQSHYFHVRLAGQFDLMLHVDRPRAGEPLERSAAWDRGELPETYPTGI